MTVSEYIYSSCMRLDAIGEGYRRKQKLQNSTSSVNLENREILRKFTRKQVKELLFENCTDCEKMAAIPQAAFATCKVRRKCDYSRNGVSKVEENEKSGKEYPHVTRYPFEGLELTPLKYNSKLMNSIWGLYNRYSVHNFKKNTDAEEGLLSAVWRATFFNPSPAVSASATASSNV